METNSVLSDSNLEKSSIKNEQKSTTLDPVQIQKPTTNKAKKLKMTLKDYLKDDNELEQENTIFSNYL